MIIFVCKCKIHGNLTLKDSFKRGFFPSGKQRYRCKICSIIHIKNYETINREKYLKRKRNYDLYNEKRDRNRTNRRLKKTFGITIEQYEEMLLKQNNCCLICKNHEKRLRPMRNKKSRICVDHCHVTGKVRGLLCWNCNALLGMAKDSIPILESAIEYLRLSRS